MEERICAVAAGKKTLADLSITGGFFDGRHDSATTEHRRQYLLHLLAQGAEPAPGEAEAAATSDPQVLSNSDASPSNHFLAASM